MSESEQVVHRRRFIRRYSRQSFLNNQQEQPRGQPVRGDAMSVSAISSSQLQPSSQVTSSTQSVHNNLRKFQADFLQLGSDLQNGTQSAAEADYSALQGLVPQGGAISTATSSNPIIQSFQQLGQNLQTGNAAGAKQDYSDLKQDFQHVDRAHGHHHSRVQDPGPTGQSSDDLGQALQSGNASSAQTAYQSLAQEFQQQSGLVDSAGLIPQLSESISNSVSVSA